MRRDYVRVRNQVEWKLAQLLFKRSPGTRNRLGQKFYPLCFNDYRYLRDGNPEWRESLFAERILHSNMTVVDVGANLGTFCLEAAEFVAPGGVVHAFEPTPTTRRQLEHHLKQNRVGNVVVLPHAVGARAGTARLRVHYQATGLNSLAVNDLQWHGNLLIADEIVEVPLVTLDEYAQTAEIALIDLLKIDVEGFELDVLRGACRLLSERRIRWIIIEISEETCRSAQVEPVDVVRELFGQDYVLAAITKTGEVGEPLTNWLPGLGPNFVAFPFEFVTASRSTLAEGLSDG